MHLGHWVISRVFCFFLFFFQIYTDSINYVHHHWSLHRVGEGPWVLSFRISAFIPCKVCPQLVWELIQAQNLASPLSSFRSLLIHPSLFYSHSKKKKKTTWGINVISSPWRPDFTHTNNLKVAPMLWRILFKKLMICIFMPCHDEDGSAYMCIC